MSNDAGFGGSMLDPPGIDEDDALIERILELHLGGEVFAVAVRVSGPELDPLPGGDWRCRFSVDGIPQIDPVRGYGHGFDTVQALIMTLQHVRLELLLLQADGVELRWLGGENLGFPKIVDEEPTVDEWRLLRSRR